ncbi:MAG: tetratricopeptide repeat protein [Planctomycetes bacterium]|nr:tetratricopeptide repeat protein [Planctomycetota bacterium]MCL4729018.1 tetratricopeptide repeat protein [Planctomycetota bacterium]
MHAETAYLFRHALLRDAAYEMQLPTDRARLHELAFFLIEQTFGGRAPEPPSLDAIDPPKLEPHPTDPVAAELAEHARLALGVPATGQPPSRASRFRPEVGVTPALYQLYLRRAAETADRAFRVYAAIAAWQALADLLAENERAEALRRAGVIATDAGALQKAATLLNHAIETARQCHNKKTEGKSIGNLANVYSWSGRNKQAETLYEQALGIARQIQSSALEGTLLGNLAIVFHESGRTDQAEHTLELALDIARKLGDRRAEGHHLGNLANIYRETGRTAQARCLYELALAIARELANRRSEGIALGGLAAVLQQTGETGQVTQTYGQALTIARAIGNRRLECQILANLAMMKGQAGQLEQAKSMHEQALSVACETEDVFAQAMILGNLAALYQQTGHLTAAASAFRQTLDIARQTGNQYSEGVLLCDYALCLLALDQRHDARETWHKGAAILRALDGSDALAHKSVAMCKACAKAGVPPFDEGQT